MEVNDNILIVEIKNNICNLIFCSTAVPVEDVTRVRAHLAAHRSVKTDSPADVQRAISESDRCVPDIDNRYRSSIAV